MSYQLRSYGVLQLPRVGNEVSQSDVLTKQDEGEAEGLVPTEALC